MTSKKEVGDIRQLAVFKLVFERNISGELQDKLIDQLNNNDTIWDITDYHAFCDKVNELITEWKTENQ